MSEFQPLVDIADLAMGETIIAADCDGLGFPIFSADTSDAPWNWSSKIKKINKTGTIVVGARGSIGFPRLPKFDSFGATQTTITVTPHSDRISAEYLHHSLNRFDFKAVSAQQAVPMLTISELGSILIRCLPLEQQVIVARVLDTLDTAIRETEALIDKLKAVKQGLLHDLLTRGIDANGQLRPPQSEAPQLYKESPLGWIPGEWEATLLGACTSWASGGTPSRAVASHWIGNVPLLTPKDMKSFELSDTVEHVSAAAAESGSRLMPAETVFIVVRGMILAHSFPVVLAARPMAFNQDVKAISAGVQLHSRFLAYWLVANSDGFLRKVTEATHGTKKLDMENLVGFPIGLPSLQEQAAIIARLDAASEKHARETAYLAQLSVMKTGLMDDLLTGRVRVTPLLESVQQAAAPIVQQPVGQTGA